MIPIEELVTLDPVARDLDRVARELDTVVARVLDQVAWNRGPEAPALAPFRCGSRLWRRQCASELTPETLSKERALEDAGNEITAVANAQVGHGKRGLHAGGIEAKAVSDRARAPTGRQLRDVRVEPAVGEARGDSLPPGLEFDIGPRAERDLHASPVGRDEQRRARRAPRRRARCERRPGGRLRTTRSCAPGRARSPRAMTVPVAEGTEGAGGTEVGKVVVSGCIERLEPRRRCDRRAQMSQLPGRWRPAPARLAPAPDADRSRATPPGPRRARSAPQGRVQRLRERRRRRAVTGLRESRRRRRVSGLEARGTPGGSRQEGAARSAANVHVPLSAGRCAKLCDP